MIDLSEFVDIPGYEGLYKINKNGQIWSHPRQGSKGGFLKLRIDKKGYCEVVLTKESKSKSYKIHRMVAEVFIENFNNKPQVNHKDGNKQNNHNWNLEWATNLENKQHGIKLNLYHHRKFSFYEAEKIRKTYHENNYNIYDMAKLFGLSYAPMWRLLNYKTYVIAEVV